MEIDIETCRAKFEEITVKSMINVDLKQKPNGEYAIPLIEDHWQTFQEGWEEGIADYDRIFKGTKYERS